MKFKILIACLLVTNIYATSCKNKKFTSVIDGNLTIKSVLDDLSSSCGLSLIVKDSTALRRLKKPLNYVSVNDVSLKSFLDILLAQNGFNYRLNRNSISVEYLSTKTFKVDYISGGRVGQSTANVTIANSTNALSMANEQNYGSGYNNKDESKTGISIKSSSKFEFWNKIKDEISRILIVAGDYNLHYEKVGEHWVSPDGVKWGYNPFEPIVNQDTGMITVTGTKRQLDRVGKYLRKLTKQLNSQVLIDVKIISVTFDDSQSMGVDWSELYSLQNLTISTLTMAQKNISSYSFDDQNGISNATFTSGALPSNASVINMVSNTKIDDIIKFLKTQGSVKSISSPKVMTLNNQPAMISVGKELFYKLKSSNTNSTVNNSVLSQGEMVDSVFAGILLDITPEIGRDEVITLKINPSISDTVESITSDGSTRDIPPDLIRRQISSVVKVKNNQHAILGGLISTKSGTKNSQVPILGDIPLVGTLFSKEEKINRVEELVIVITPHITNNNQLSVEELGYERVNEE